MAVEIETTRAEYYDGQPRRVVAQPVVTRPAVAEPVVVQAAVAEPVVQIQPPVATAAYVNDTAYAGENVVRTSWFTPAAVVAGIVSVILLLLGGITVARAGLDGPLDDPVVEVAGFSATAVLGLIELAVGFVLLAAALARSEGSILFIGILTGVAALVGVFQPTVGDGALALESGFATLVAMMMAAVVGTGVLPTIRRRTVISRRI